MKSGHNNAVFQNGTARLSCNLDFSSWCLMSSSPWLLISSHGFDWISCCCLTFTLKFPSRASFGGQGRRVTGIRRLDLDLGIILWEDIEWSKWREKAGMLQIASFLISVPSDGRFSRFIRRLFFLSCWGFLSLFSMCGIISWLSGLGTFFFFIWELLVPKICQSY